MNTTLTLAVIGYGFYQSPAFSISSQSSPFRNSILLSRFSYHFSPIMYISSYFSSTLISKSIFSHSLSTSFQQDGVNNHHLFHPSRKESLTADTISFYDCEFADNCATNIKGGSICVINFQCSMTLERCMFYRSRVIGDGGGGAMYANTEFFCARQCFFNGCSVDYSNIGHGIFVYSKITLILSYIQLVFCAPNISHIGNGPLITTTDIIQIHDINCSNSVSRSRFGGGEIFVEEYGFFTYSVVSNCSSEGHLMCFTKKRSGASNPNLVSLIFIHNRANKTSYTFYARSDIIAMSNCIFIDNNCLTLLCGVKQTILCCCYFDKNDSFLNLSQNILYINSSISGNNPTLPQHWTPSSGDYSMLPTRISETVSLTATVSEFLSSMFLTKDSCTIELILQVSIPYSSDGEPIYTRIGFGTIAAILISVSTTVVAATVIAAVAFEWERASGRISSVASDFSTLF